MENSKKHQGRRAWEKGVFSENLGAWYFRLKGYSVVKKRFKTPVGEIDLILRRGKNLVFVEVKHRNSFDAAAESITPHQQKRIRRAAELYLSRTPWTKEIRFDVLLVKPWSFPVHLKHVFME